MIPYSDATGQSAPVDEDVDRLMDVQDPRGT